MNCRNTIVPVYAVFAVISVTSMVSLGLRAIDGDNALLAWLENKLQAHFVSIILYITVNP